MFCSDIKHQCSRLHAGIFERFLPGCFLSSAFSIFPSLFFSPSLQGTCCVPVLLQMNKSTMLFASTGYTSTYLRKYRLEICLAVHLTFDSFVSNKLEDSKLQSTYHLLLHETMHKNGFLQENPSFGPCSEYQYTFYICFL